ncbi:MAG: biotin/lipoyl-containing protein [Acidobacteriota bacterium]
MRWWIERDGSRIEVSARRLGDSFEVTVDGHAHVVELVAVAPGLASLLCQDGRSYSIASQRRARGHWRVSVGDREFEVRLRDPLEREVASRDAGGGGPQELRAPIPGKVVSVAVSPGQAVHRGQALLVLEAMKMENQICAETEGTVDAVLVTPGTAVEGGQVLVVLR